MILQILSAGRLDLIGVTFTRALSDVTPLNALLVHIPRWTWTMSTCKYFQLANTDCSQYLQWSDSCWCSSYSDILTLYDHIPSCSLLRNLSECNFGLFLSFSGVKGQDINKFYYWNLSTEMLKCSKLKFSDHLNRIKLWIIKHWIIQLKT